MLNIYIISPEKGGNNDESNTSMSLRSAKAANQSRRHGRDLVGLAPQTKLQAPQIEIWSPINQWNFCQYLMSSPPART